MWLPDVVYSKAMGGYSYRSAATPRCRPRRGHTDMSADPRDSKTYKLRAETHSKHAIYFTIVDGDNGPEAFFINCKEMSDYQYFTSLMTSYSRQIQAGVAIGAIIADMRETFDPKGKYFLEDGSGREVNSLVHHLGLVLEEHVTACQNAGE